MPKVNVPLFLCFLNQKACCLPIITDNEENTRTEEATDSKRFSRFFFCIWKFVEVLCY